MVVDKQTKNVYRIAKAQAFTMLQNQILNEYGDSVVVTGLTDDENDSSYFVINTS